MSGEGNSSFDVENFLSELRATILTKKRRFQDQGVQKWYPDIFAERRSRLLTKRDSESTASQVDIRNILRIAFEKRSVDGEHSPLSPVSDIVSTNEDDSSSSSPYLELSLFEYPLYFPKICSCRVKKEKPTQHYYCENEECEGLFQVPYSLIQVYLNRKINSVNSFVSKVKGLPGSLVIYYGKLRNSIIIVINNKDQEKLVIKSLSHHPFEIGCISVYRVSTDDSKNNQSVSYTAKLKFKGFPDDKALNSL